MTFWYIGFKDSKNSKMYHSSIKAVDSVSRFHYYILPQSSGEFDPEGDPEL